MYFGVWVKKYRRNGSARMSPSAPVAPNKCKLPLRFNENILKCKSSVLPKKNLYAIRLDEYGIGKMYDKRFNEILPFV